ncbi:MAG: amino acid adenylation domain-containing protein, partial [Limisphaerales bacterium]
GITETTVHVTYRRITKGDVERGRGSPIGVPIPDLQVHVLDPEMQPVGRGGEGEIYVGGAGVAIGYLNRAELTAERFISDPICPVPGRRLYKSGDCARVLDNGELEYLGRNDDQVKIHGFRVETGDIEAAINRHPEVADSKVLLRKTPDEDKQLVAYVIWRCAVADTTALRNFLSDKLPTYMVPAKFVALKSFPLTTNGKLDRNALPAPNRCRPHLTHPYVAPRNPKEKILAEIWQGVLNVEPVGIHDSFFELGGDSIRSIQVVSRAAKAGVHFTAADLFRAGNIVDLLHVRQESTRSNDDVQLITESDAKLLPADVEDAYPMSQLQIGMVYHGQLDPSSAVYHDIFSYKISGQFDAGKINRAIQQLGERYSILRTSFELSRYSKPMQLVHQTVRIPFSVEDVQHLNAREQDVAIQNWIEQEKRVPFDFSCAPLLRWKVHLRGKDHFQLSYSSHHAILDGWSLAAMLTEVIDCYSALLNGGVVSPAPTVSYQRFIALEQAAVQDENSRHFWLKRLEHFQPTNLPRIVGDKSATAGEVRVHQVPLPCGVSEKLRTMAAEEGLPLKCLLLSAHLKVLSFVCGQTDVTTGFVMEGRPSEEDGEKILGLFLNTVPFRINLAGGSWRDLARDIFQHIGEMMPHRRYPLAEMQRRMGGVSLFETAFDMVHFHVYEKVLQNRAVTFVEDKFFESTNFPFFAFFQVDPATLEISLRFDFQPAEIGQEQIQALAGYYAATLEAIATDPTSRYEKFSPMSQLEHRKILELSHGKNLPNAAPDTSVLAYFNNACANVPNRVALTANGHEISYGDLANAVDVVARALGANTKRKCVAIIAERSVEALIGILGTLRAGAAYVPIDPNQPRARVESILSQANVSTVLATRALNYELGAVEVLRIDTLLSAVRQAVIVNNFPRVTANDLAYVLFTSGSTGAPKGVQVTHGNLLHSTLARLDYYAQPVRSFLLASPHWFDSSVAGIFWTLSQAGQLVVPNDLEVKDPAALVRLIEASRVSHLLCLPSVYSLLLSYADRLSSLETVIVAGEECPRDLVLRHQKLLPGAELFNEYGPTEATVWCSVYKCPEVVPAKIPIGRPIANTATLILNEQLQPVPVGTPGEIYVGGNGVALGYLNADKTTTQSFVDCPAQFGLRGKIYKTGDLGRYLSDGNIEFLGRRDDQVKLRGMRIELSEIQSALSRHPAIEECVVVLAKSARGEQRLAAYIQTAWPITSEQLNAFLKESLPPHMLPSAYLVMNAIPHTSNGKVDRNALPPIADAHTATARAYNAPSTPFENEIAKIWSDVLQMEKVGADWDFLEIGGHSLSAMQVAARVVDRFQVEIPLADFFHNATVSQQARMVLQNLARKQSAHNGARAIKCPS